MINPNSQNKLPAKIKAYWLTQIISVFAVAVALSFTVPFSWMTGLVSGFGLLLGACAYIYLLLYFHFFSFVVEDKKITINSGIIIKRSKTISFDQIQSVDNVRGILAQVFGLTKTNIWTSSPQQINLQSGQSQNLPDVSIILLREDGDWLKNFTHK